MSAMAKGHQKRVYHVQEVLEMMTDEERRSYLNLAGERREGGHQKSEVGRGQRGRGRGGSWRSWWSIQLGR